MMKIKEIWQRLSINMPFKWSTLKSLANSRFARLTLLVPIVGWLLIYKDFLITILNQYFEAGFDDDLSWRLYIFYIGLFQISISSILYNIFCPKDINSHPDAVDFVRHYRVVFTEKFQQSLNTRADSPMKWNEPPKQFANVHSGDYPLVRKHSENEEQIIDQLMHDYKMKNHSWPIIRLLTFIIFTIGTCTVMVPTISTVHKASCSLVENASNDFWINKLENTCSFDRDSGVNHLKNMK